ncbi:unnamed protein product [Caenorhabditis brenneri]
MLGEIFWLLLVFSSPNLIFGDENDGFNLVYAQVLFRHGARAPTEQVTDPAYQKSFPRGLGEMTDRGYDNSYLLGQYLKQRYVDTSFLDANLQPGEMHWRSVNKNRCLSTASTVGAAMFDDHLRHLHVPGLWILKAAEGQTQTQTESTRKKFQLLNYNLKECPRENELVRERCPDFNGEYTPWPEYEEFIANCLNYTHPIFAEYPFHTIEAHMNEYKNNLNLPKNLATHINEIMAIYVNVTQFITGTGNHHDPRMMRVKFGNLVRTLLNNVGTARDNMEAFKKGMKIKQSDVRKFTAYSTQDWILMGVLDSLGVLKETVGLEVYPEYNSMIIIELYERKGEYFVKTFYKKEEITALNHQLIDVSHLVRNCPRDQPYCPLANFKSCCADYESDPGAGCLSKNRKLRRSIREDSEPVFFGPA